MNDASRSPIDALEDPLHIERYARIADADHDLRTPLNVIIGLTETLLRSDLRDTQREHLRTVMESGESLLAVVEDLLDLSKIDAGRFELERSEFDLHEVVAQALRPFALEAQRKRIELIGFIEPALPHHLLGDPGRLGQVIGKLVADAVRVTERGEVVVRVEGDAAGGVAMLRFCVEDTRPEDASSRNAERSGEGQGLEWSLVRKLVERMGGELSAGRKPGQEHTYRFTAKLEAAPATGEAESSAPAVLNGARVLIVDESATQRSLLEAIARSAGMRPVQAASAYEALAPLEEGIKRDDPIRLMLVGLRGSGSDDIALAQRVRRDARHAELEIVFLAPVELGSALDPAHAVLGARVSKPVSQPELLRVMARRLGGEREEALAAPESEAPDAPDAAPALRLVLADGHEIQLRDDGRDVYVPEKKILLLEDSVANQMVTQAMLRERYTIAIASTGRRALEMLSQQHFDAALLDVELPGMSGLEVAAAIRSAEATTKRRLPLIAMTAHALEGDRDRCLEAGMDDYIAKPVHRDALLAALSAAIGAAEPAGRPCVSEGGDAPGQGLLDWSGPRARTKGDPEALRSLVASSAAEIREHLEHLPRQSAAGEASELQQRARALKGTMRLFGAIEPYQLAQQLEDAAATAVPPALLAGLEDSLGDVLAEFDRVLDAEPQRAS